MKPLRIVHQLLELQIGKSVTDLFFYQRQKIVRYIKYGNHCGLLLSAYAAHHSMQSAPILRHMLIFSSLSLTETPPTFRLLRLPKPTPSAPESSDNGKNRH